MYDYRKENLLLMSMGARLFLSFLTLVVSGLHQTKVIPSIFTKLLAVYRISI